MDFLVFNGDILNFCDSIENFNTIYKISSEIAKGEIPIVFARGNHDMRGRYAEKLSDFTPTDNGNSYYTFRLGSIWGMVLDCGEDKLDSRKEYGNTISCQKFRERETQFIYDVIESEEYNAHGITQKLIISHNPFFYKPADPTFDIEDDLFNEWCRLLREYIKPTLMLCGHMHALHICEPGGSIDNRGLPCLAVVGSDIHFDEYYIGCGIEINGKNIEITYTNDKGEIIEIIKR